MTKTETRVTADHPQSAGDSSGPNATSETSLRRRTIVQVAAGASLLQVASPFIITARAADTVKLGLDNPL
ncbi:MAG TPA: hypothetical protein VNS31_06630, partial [Ramlibacter sp.]|nr:hypothetical protein [Ramlibacter sp.]